MKRATDLNFSTISAIKHTAFYGLVFLVFLDVKFQKSKNHYRKSEATLKIAPNTVSSKIIPIKEITKPAIANPLGCLNTPTNDNISPNNQIIQPNTGTQPKKIAIKASTKPAVPMSFDFFPTD